MRREVRFDGSITIFLSLMLVCILGFSGACLEYARAQTVSCQVQMAADSSTESIFAGYHDPLFSRYQLLGRLIPSGNFEALEKETLRYAAAYGEKTGLLDRANMAAFSAADAQWSEISYLTDQNGRIFTNMAAKSMTVSGVSVVMSQWKSRLGLSDGSTAEVMEENSGRESWNLKDIIGNYDGWESRVEDAEKAAAEAAKEEEERAIRAAEAAGELGYTIKVEPKGPDREGTKVLNLIETMKSLLKNGTLSLVLPKGAAVSSGMISASGLPSALSSSAKGRTVGTAVSGGNSLLFHEYLTRNMDCFTSEAEKSVAYELEYLIAGKKSDRENLQSVATRLVWMRIGMNMLYLNKSPSKKAEAREAALLAVGWTGQPLLVEGTMELLLSVWAAAESIVDVRSLLAGNKVPLLKTDADWNLELKKIAAACKETATGKSSEDGKGLSYVDYLRICMYLMSETTLAYRGMDVIQWNICRMDPTFSISTCMVRGRMELTASSDPVFVVLYRRIGSMGNAAGAVMKKNSSFSYLS